MHTFKPYADHPDLCVAELPCGDTCNQTREYHAERFDGDCLCSKCGAFSEHGGYVTEDDDELCADCYTSV